MSEHGLQSAHKADAKPRNNHIAQTLTESQSDIAKNLASIINRQIHKTGSFREPLTDYAHAYSRSEKFDAATGEVIIREVFTAEYGQTMNALRETLLNNEKNLPESARERAIQAARQTLDSIAQGETEPFFKAYDRESNKLAQALNITESGAKKIMVESYRAIEGRELYEAGKALVEQHHKPKFDEARVERKTARSRSVVRSD